MRNVFKYCAVVLTMAAAVVVTPAFSAPNEGGGCDQKDLNSRSFSLWYARAAGTGGVGTKVIRSSQDAVVVRLCAAWVKKGRPNVEKSRSRCDSLDLDKSDKHSWFNQALVDVNNGRAQDSVWNGIMGSQDLEPAARRAICSALVVANEADAAANEAGRQQQRAAALSTTESGSSSSTERECFSSELSDSRFRGYLDAAIHGGFIKGASARQGQKTQEGDACKIWQRHGKPSRPYSNHFTP